MVGAHLRFYDIDPLPTAQRSQDLPYFPPLFSVEYLPPVLWRKDDVIFAIPLRSVYKELHADRETGC